MFWLRICAWLTLLVTVNGLKWPVPNVLQKLCFPFVRSLSKQVEQTDGSVRSWRSSLQPLQNQNTVSIQDFTRMRRNEKANIVINEVANGDMTRLTSLCRERSSDLSYLVTRSLPAMKPSLLLTFWQDQVLANDETAGALDIQAHCAAMTALTRLQHYELALRTYEALANSNQSIDIVTYVCAMRAAGFCRDLRYVIQLLDRAFDAVGAHALEVAKTAIINLKYMRRNGNLDSSPQSAATCMRLAEALYTWVVDKGLEPDAHIMDSLLAVACVHGSAGDCALVQKRMAHWSIPPTSFTYNTLLDRCARLRDTAQATEVIRCMREQGITPDTTTYNTLLKLRVNLNDVAGAEKIAKFMEESPNIGVSSITQSLLFRLYRSNSATTTSRQTVESLLHDRTEADAAGNQTASVTASASECMYATAIDACADANTALLLLRQAQKRRLADQAVFIAAAKRLAQETRYGEAYDIIHEMLFLDGLEMDKFALSLVIRVSLDALKVKQHEGLAVSSISRYVTHCIQKHPQLLTRAVWNQLKDLLPLGHCELFAELLISAAVTSPALVNAQVTGATLTAAFSALQEQWDNAGAHPTRPSAEVLGAVNVALALLKALCWAHSQCSTPLAAGTVVATSTSTTTQTGDRRVPLFTSHFNLVLRMLSTAQEFVGVKEVYRIMRGDSPDTHLDGAQNEEQQAGVQTWQPSTFTIAELVRCGRQSGDLTLLVGALAWAMEELVFIPLGVISEVLSYLYSEGHSEALTVLYKELYDRGHVSHWAAGDRDRDSTALTMDLHEFSRAMAFAAIKTAVQEIKNRKGEVHSGRQLTIITGQNAEVNRAKEEPYVLSNIVQEVLVEDFYPPISSSTVPGNPGRLQV